MEEAQDWQSGMLKVVKSVQGHYSIWPVDRENPNGWVDAGKTGLKDECLAFIETVWEDPYLGKKR